MMIGEKKKAAGKQQRAQRPPLRAGGLPPQLLYHFFWKRHLIWLLINWLLTELFHPEAERDGHRRPKFRKERRDHVRIFES